MKPLRFHWSQFIFKKYYCIIKFLAIVYPMSYLNLYVHSFGANTGARRIFSARKEAADARGASQSSSGDEAGSGPGEGHAGRSGGVLGNIVFTKLFGY